MRRVCLVAENIADRHATRARERAQRAEGRGGLLREVPAKRQQQPPFAPPGVCASSPAKHQTSAIIVAAAIPTTDPPAPPSRRRRHHEPAPATAPLPPHRLLCVPNSRASPTPPLCAARHPPHRLLCVSSSSYAQPNFSSARRSLISARCASSDDILVMRGGSGCPVGWLWLVERWLGRAWGWLLAADDRAAMQSRGARRWRRVGFGRGCRQVGRSAG